jgi:hypothetical protein
VSGPTAAAIPEEALRARRAQLAVDLTCSLIAQSRDLSLAEALGMMADARRIVLGLFPDKESTFNLIYRPRFHRLLRERLGLSEEEIGALG